MGLAMHGDPGPVPPPLRFRVHASALSVEGANQPARLLREKLDVRQQRGEALLFWFLLQQEEEAMLFGVLQFRCCRLTTRTWPSPHHPLTY